jgi:hypothetical protein
MLYQEKSGDPGSGWRAQLLKRGQGNWSIRIFKAHPGLPDGIFSNKNFQFGYILEVL